tara:strand:- start:3529 stop:4125 length:597 start_codon:yes stop_codon:yes gene_type:complete
MQTITPDDSAEIWGDKIIQTDDESYFKEHTYKSGNSTVQCTTLYCPKCSQVREKDTRQGGYRNKWTIAKTDYNLTLEYKKDDTGFYAQCSKCGHDVRNHEEKHDSYISVLVEEGEDDGPPLPLEKLEGAVYQQGFVILSFSEYERVRKTGTQKNGLILPTITIENKLYCITWDDFLRRMKAIPNISVIGIPKTYWKLV